MRSFLVLGLPAPQGSKTHVGDGRMVESSKRVKPWRRQVAAAYADRNFGDMLDGPVSIIVDFYLPRPKAHYGTGRNRGQLRPSAPTRPAVKPDVDKLARAVDQPIDAAVSYPQASRLGFIGQQHDDRAAYCAVLVALGRFFTQLPIDFAQPCSR